MMMTSSLLLTATSLLLAITVCIGQTFDNDAIELTLPTSIGVMTHITPLLVGNENDDMLVPVLLPLSQSNHLVTLNAVEKGVYVPVGRSYDYNEWENVAGPYEGTLDYTCKDPNIFGHDLTHHCQVYLPLDNPSATYFLTVYTHDISTRAEIARFLERTSFGGTPDEITALAGGGNLPLSMANWITNQIDNVGVSSHREYFRKRLNPRSIENYKYGINGPSACEANSRWRAFALTRKDLRLSTYEEVYNLEIEQVVANDGSGDIGYILRFANHIRTVLMNPLEYYGSGSNTINVEGIVSPGSYKLCYVEEIEGKVRSGKNDVRTLAIEVFDDDCRFIKGGNPTVNLDPRFVDMTNDVIVLNLSVFTTTDTAQPSSAPSDSMYPSQSLEPSSTPTISESPSTSSNPSTLPSQTPSTLPSMEPSSVPSMVPSESSYPSASPSDVPSSQPSTSSYPSTSPSTTPSINPTLSSSPSSSPSLSTKPSSSQYPSTSPSEVPTQFPTTDIHIITINGEITRGSDYLLLVDVRHDPTCDRIPTPYDNDFRGFDRNHPMEEGRFENYVGKTASKFDQDQTVFALMPGGFYALHDQRLLTIENSIENPAMDGGGSNVMLASPDGYDMVTFCANAPMTPFNEDHCKLSFEKNTCIPYGVGNGEQDGEYTIEHSFPDPEENVNGVVVCGSPGEVASDPELDDFFDIYNNHLDSMPEQHLHKVVWFNLAFGAPDQLRQRLAWSLSQIFVVSPSQIGAGSNLKETYMSFYDIFIRNAFGNYRDIIKEVSYHPRMAEMLTYINNKASHYNWHRDKKMLFPDENYARELFQLFTTGLVKMNMDGTPFIDRFGVHVKTFDSKDVVSFGRAWTGFYWSPRRGNYEDLDHSTVSRMDPMRILGRYYRDRMPKRGLNNQYVGDYYPLCYDLPSQSFLRKGAKYRLLGGSPDSTHNWLEYRTDIQWRLEDLEQDEIRSQIVSLHSERSGLYGMLCNDEGSGCQYPSTVILNENLACHGIECEVDTVRIVEVGGIYYEHLRQPCVQQMFFDDGKKVYSGHFTQYTMCAHPKMAVASPTCCNLPIDENGRIEEDWSITPCRYIGDRVTYQSNSGICTSLGGFACDPVRTVTWEGSGYTDCLSEREASQTNNYDNTWHWTTESCNIQVKILSNGLMAVVHDPNKSRNVYNTDYKPYTNSLVNVTETVSFFSVHWDKNVTGDDQFPSVDNNCGEGACELLEDETCYCDTTTSEEVVFDSLPSREDALEQLTVGAFPTDMYDENHYVLVSEGTDIKSYRLFSSGSDYTIDTIFEVKSKFNSNDVMYLKNVKSSVTVAGLYTIRNPPHFMDLVDPEDRDAYYETDAVIDHILHNENTPPFVAKLLIQHAGNSNPAPRYIEVVATAFRDGIYTWSDGSNNVEFGTGEWGDMAATVAAIYLDREATTVVLDADPTYGAIREPLVKVVSMMRSLEFERTDIARNAYAVFRNGMSDYLGQMPYEQQSVFSFFSPLHSPPGFFSRANLLAPEAMVLSLKTTVLTQNGMYGLIRNGLALCDYGFGPQLYNNYGLPCRELSTYQAWKPGYFKNSVGSLSYEPTNHGLDVASGIAIVSELGDILTSGRLSDENKQFIVAIYNSQYASEGAAVALRMALQLIVTSPEFHTNSLVNPSATKREPEPQPVPNEEPYKAILYIHLFGGLDSFYMLSPHPSCEDMYSEYVDVRGANQAALLEEDMLMLDAPTSDQPCDKFGLNKNLDVFKDIYDAGHGQFHANTGHLTKLVSKYNYFTETRTQLFSHHSMTLEAQVVDALREQAGTGVLGRMLDVLSDDGYSVAPFGINRDSPILEGDSELGRQVDVVSSGGAATFYSRSVTGDESDQALMEEYFKHLHNETDDLNSGKYAELYSRRFINAINKTEFLRDVVPSDRDLSQSYTGGLGRSLKMVSKLILSHEDRKTNRDTYYVSMGGFDTHSNVKGNLDNENWGRFQDINKGIKAFYEELKEANLLDSVTVVIGSEFGRTITPNAGGGTDHAWGGNYFVFGGQMKGKKVLGEYPEGFSSNDPTNDGRGRLVPTTPWDSIWNGIAQWYGITSEVDLDYVLPNRNNFGCRLYTDSDLYIGGTNTIEGCNGECLTFEQEIIMSEARYLGDAEQKAYCSLLIGYVDDLVDGGVVRCFLVDQKVEAKGDGTYGITIVVELCADLEGFGHDAAALLTTNRAEIADRAAEEGIVPDVVGVTETLLITPQPSVSMYPSATPSESSVPSAQPSQVPSISTQPSLLPSMTPSISLEPSLMPSTSSSPSMLPSSGPSSGPSSSPSVQPSSPQPSASMHPSAAPSVSSIPSGQPSQVPSISAQPSLPPSMTPSTSFEPSPMPSTSASPSMLPSSEPSSGPSSSPSVQPSTGPSTSPSFGPSTSPSIHPSISPSVSCQDSPTEDWFYIKKDKKKDCTEVAKDPKKRCDKEKDEDGIMAYDGCPLTCGICTLPPTSSPTTAPSVSSAPSPEAGDFCYGMALDEANHCGEEKDGRPKVMFCYHDVDKGYKSKCESPEDIEEKYQDPTDKMMMHCGCCIVPDEIPADKQDKHCPAPEARKRKLNLTPRGA